MVPGDSKWFSVLDLKDAFFCSRWIKSATVCLWLVEPRNKSRSLIPLDCAASRIEELPDYFRKVLAQDLRDVQLKSRVLLQYVDDILIASSNYEGCLHTTTSVLNHLARTGYKVLPHKAQICKQEVAYLGFQLKQGTRYDPDGRQKASHCCIKSPREPKAALWVLRVLPNLDSKLWAYSKTAVQFLKRPRHWNTRMDRRLSGSI